jgi:hypothetical protein
VCYRFPLEEEITTVKFVARHSDLSSSDESESESGPEAASEELDDSLDLPTSDEDGRIQARPKKDLKRYSRRQIRAAAVRDGLGDSRDQTVASKTPSDRKKRRRWEWTLGPLDEEGAGESVPDLAEIPPTGGETGPANEQASTSPSADTPQASVGQSIHSPAPQASPSLLILPQTAPLPESPADATQTRVDEPSR